jgi:hypothetical protein
VSHAITTANQAEATPRGEVTPDEWQRVRRWSATVAVGGTAAFVVLSFLLWLIHGIDAPKQIFVSYLVGFNYWLGCALGGLVFLMLQYVTGGAWGILLRRIFEASSSMLLPLAILFVPLVIGLSSVYEYGQWSPVHTEEKLASKAAWLSAPAVTIKAIVFFACWNGLAYLFRRWSKLQDEGANGQVLQRCESLGAPGILIYALTITFASIDWVMALQPEWYSTIYPVMFAVGQLLNGYAFALVVFLLLSNRPPFAGSIHPSHMRDFGSLLLAFVMFWAYMSFSQFLLVWVGNLKEEIPWYLLRARGGWEYVIIFIAVFHFAVPFLLLMLRDIKEHRLRLLAVALGLLIMRFIDLFWWIEPSLNHGGQYFYWLLDISAWIALGGACVWWFTGTLQSRSLLPVNDPYLEEALRDE